MEQEILIASENYKELDDYLIKNDFKIVLLVCGSSLPFFKISGYLDGLESRIGVKVIKFDNFKPNPLYESVVEAVKVFHKNHCDSIIAIGGGSAIDVAKCVKLYSNMNPVDNYLYQKIVPNDIKLLVLPTTAGTGSEATKYAVIYFKGEKQSIMDDSCIPSAVLIDESVLETLPKYQKKSTMMDALCHAIESFWSINSTDKSKEYSRQAIQLILNNKDAYLSNNRIGNANMLKAANIAGKAINITQTTAGHAMCYKLTSLYHIAHGHAAALCVSKLWQYMINHMEKCIDFRGIEYLESVFKELADIFECESKQTAVLKFQNILKNLDLYVPKAKSNDYDVLKTSVVSERLKNNPIALDEQAIDILYHQILTIK